MQKIFSGRAIGGKNVTLSSAQSLDARSRPASFLATSPNAMRS
jgi:hypothetical protein